MKKLNFNEHSFLTFDIIKTFFTKAGHFYDLLYHFTMSSKLIIVLNNQIIFFDPIMFELIILNTVKPLVSVNFGSTQKLTLMRGLRY